MTRKPALLVVVALAIAACTPGTGAGSPPASALPDGSPSPAATTTGIAHPAGPADLVLRVERAGGLVAPGWILTQLPVISIYGNGLVVAQGVQIEIYPAPALPAIVQSRVSEAGLQRILQAARSAGLLGPDRHFDNPEIADAPTTVFTVVADGTTHTTAAYALREGEDSPTMPADERVARQELSTFATQLADLAGWLGSDLAAAGQPYDFAALRVFATPATPDPNAEIAPSFTDWPLGMTLDVFGAPLSGYGAEKRCGIVSGANLVTLRAALERANALTFWRSGNSTYQLGLRPLLPDETGCPQDR